MSTLNVPLLRKAVDWAKDEQVRKERTPGGVYGLRDDQGEHSWLQGSWATIKLGMNWKKHSRDLKNHLNVVAVDTMSCGSTGCLAGHICVISGDDYVVPKFAEPGAAFELEHVADAEGVVYHIPQRASHHLGIDYEQTGNLFSGSNTPEALEAFAKELCENFGEEW